MPLIQVKLIEEVFTPAQKEGDHHETHGRNGRHRGREPCGLSHW